MLDVSVNKVLKSRNKIFTVKYEFTVNHGDFVAVYGKSGAGKSTLINILSGLIKPDCGFIKYNNDIWFDHKKKIFAAPQKRSIGYLFQDYRLFYNMSVLRNITYITGGRNNDFAGRLLCSFGLAEYADRNPRILSGGQKQRLALARCIARRPDLLLLDEPFSALDHETKHDLLEIIISLYREFNMTVIMISHNFNEIANLANKILFVKDGLIAKEKEILQVNQDKIKDCRLKEMLA